jgi:tetratricopeptide (TPR) repeat protein
LLESHHPKGPGLDTERQPNMLVDYSEERAKMICLGRMLVDVIMFRRWFVASALAFCVALLATDRSAALDSLGDVHFPTSCRASTRQNFDHGLALLHSFEFTEAEAVFREVEKTDPKCAIAAWGVALSITERSGANAPRKELAQGWSELQPWLAIQAGSEREQMYIDAVRAMYEGYETVPGSKRWQDYLTRMRALGDKYPDDINARLFYGLGLTWTAGPGETGLKQRREALGIFLPIFEQYPNNPGAAHYIIHAADTAELAAEALPAARKYAAIAPDSPHALHMPSHIFNRLGLWRDSVRTNEASARVAAAWMKAGRAGNFDEFHALNNIEYALLQLGEDQKAKRIVEQITALAKGEKDPWLPIDARIYYDLETHDWQDAARIEPPLTSSFEENFDAYWIETIGAARCGDSIRARAAFAKYRDSEIAWNKSHGFGDILGVGLAEAEAWTLFSEGKREEAVTRLRSMRQFERDHPMYYADILPRPTGEMLGDMLLLMNRPADALVAYKQSLELAPNRLDSLLGARRAAELAGQPSVSREFTQKITDEGGVIASRR